MEPRNWIQEKFGTGEPQTLLDEEVYSSKQLRKDKQTLQLNLKKSAKEQQKHEQKYQALLQKGAQAQNEAKQRQFATKAKFEKKKYKAKEKSHKADSIKLGTVIAIDGMREVLEIQKEGDTELEAAIEDADIQELENQIIGQMADFGLEIEDMKQIQEALDIELLDEDLENDVSEELQMMREMEADDLADEQIDLDAETNQDDVDVNVDVDEDFEMGASMYVS
jgi:hypothetical protein